MRYVDSIKDIEENAVIYGTGMVAKLLYRYLIRRGWKKLIFTESVQNSNSFLLGAPVKSLDDIASDNQIIIATLSNYHDEIASVLIDKKRCNFYAVSEAFFQSMRNETIYEHNEIASLNLRVSELKRLADEKCRDVDFAIVSDNGLVKNIYFRLLHYSYNAENGAKSNYPKDDSLLLVWRQGDPGFLKRMYGKLV